MSKKKKKRKCKHIYRRVKDMPTAGYFVLMDNKYCPKCGEKL